MDTAPEMMEFLEKSSSWFEFVWKPGYADYYPELPGGSERGSTINVPEIDLRKLGAEERNLLTPLALAPRGIWFAPKDLRLFYQVRQNWRGKAVLLKLVWRMFRARVFGDRMAAIGQSLMARMRLACKDHDIPLWLDAPMTELITDVDGRVVGAVVERDGVAQRIGARRGVILASGGFDHDMTWRREHLPELEKDWSFGNPAAMGDGIRAGEKVGGSTDLHGRGMVVPRHVLARRPAAVHAQRADDAITVRRQRSGQAVHQRGGALHGLRARHDRGAAHRRVARSVLARHRHPLVPPLRRRWPSAHPEDPVRTRADGLEGAAGVAGLGNRQGRQQLRGARRPRSVSRQTSCARTAERFNELARKGHDDDFDRGDSAYDNYYGDPTLPNPNLHPLGEAPYYAFQIILGDLGTSGGLRTDEYARVLRDDDSVIAGLYATGNATAAVMGRSYAGAGATIGPAMTFGYVAAKTHRFDRRTTSHTTSESTLDTTGGKS